MNLTNRKRSLLVLDKWVCCCESVFNDVNDQADCFNELGYYYLDYCAQTKSCEGEKERESDANEEDETTEAYKDADSEIETEADGRSGCTRMVLDSCVTKKKNVLGHVKTQADSVATRKEHDIEIANQIDHKVKQRKSCRNKELNCEPNEKLDAHKRFWGVSMKVMLDRLIKESGDECTFGCMPELCFNSPCKLGVLTSESFLKE